MAAHSRVIFSDEADGNAIARHWIRKTGYMLQKGLDYRMVNEDKHQFTDIFYNDLKDSSFDVLSEVYQMNGGITPELLARFEQAERENPMRKYGIHDYKLEDFGAKKEDILNETVEYRKYINL
jgi:hypothetical protein